ncbi:MAG: hypothetical protein CM15mP84_03310 [Cellvibrionales bacterium]|nr:MAG: hypothetical protein CM15mP84_03310 [Cellvibrionales bacterium]
MGHMYLGYARDKRPSFSLMWEDRGDMEARGKKLPRSTGFYVAGASGAAILRRKPLASINSLHLATQIWSWGTASLRLKRIS